jgi:DNA-binding HxlR family transcriptional regulator
MRHVSFASMPCPIARTLDVVGEWWTLLLIRDALLGVRRFEDFKASGIADNVLTARLKKLTDAGIFKRRPYQSRPDRYEYVLTKKGWSLAPVVLALRAWGRRWTSGLDLSEIRHANCSGEIALEFRCTACDSAVPATEVSAAPKARSGARS